jgi:hypothetical protein
MAKKKKAKGKHAGQPTKYNSSLDDLVYKLCLLNATDVQIADVLGICEATLNNWKKKYPRFLESIKRGKIYADAKVAGALFHRACGYSHPDVHISNYQGDITITDITKHYPPDTAAAFIWLKNRAGWKDKTEHVLDDSDKLTDAERENLREILRERQQPLKLVKGA